MNPCLFELSILNSLQLLVLHLNDVAQDHPLSGSLSVLWQQLRPFFLLRAHVLLLQTSEHFWLPVGLAVLLRIHYYVHSKALGFNFAGGHQVGADGFVFRQVSSEVHFLPLEHLLHVLASWKAKFPKVPSPNEVNLAIYN
jgi:hypothetical protein